jgi:hypothetical protein
MKARIPFLLDVRVIRALLVASLSTIWLAPAASAQTVILAGSMDSKLPVSPGDTVAVGYEVALADASPSPTATMVSVTNAVVQLSVSCPNGKSQTITIKLPSQSFSVSANNNSWVPSDSVYQGQTTVPSTLCGGHQGTTNGATFMATSGFSCHENSVEGCCHNVCFRFHHRHHHDGDDEGGTFSDTSCKIEKYCNSPENREHGQCCETKE